ncbi:sulfurtransferase TusA family protein [Candidatus Dependentiae bacterium]|nr:sulfurtransferase TusA family protein [Candidatus Dependentiae bacterium]
MAVHNLDFKGLACPQPVLKLQIASMKMAAGDVINVEADCSTFNSDIQSWCSRMGKILVSCSKDGNVWKAQIQL